MAAKRKAAESPYRKKLRLDRAKLLAQDLEDLPKLEEAITSLSEDGEVAPKNLNLVLLTLMKRVADIKASHQASKAPPSKRY